MLFTNTSYVSHGSTIFRLARLSTRFEKFLWSSRFRCGQESRAGDEIWPLIEHRREALMGCDVAVNELLGDGRSTQNETFVIAAHVLQKSRKNIVSHILFFLYDDPFDDHERRVFYGKVMCSVHSRVVWI